VDFFSSPSPSFALPFPLPTAPSLLILSVICARSPLILRSPQRLPVSCLCLMTQTDVLLGGLVESLGPDAILIFLVTLYASPSPNFFSSSTYCCSPPAFSALFSPLLPSVKPLGHLSVWFSTPFFIGQLRPCFWHPEGVRSSAFSSPHPAPFSVAAHSDTLSFSPFCGDEIGELL